MVGMFVFMRVSTKKQNKTKQQNVSSARPCIPGVIGGIRPTHPGVYVYFGTPSQNCSETGRGVGGPWPSARSGGHGAPGSRPLASGCPHTVTAERSGCDGVWTTRRGRCRPGPRQSRCADSRAHRARPSPLQRSARLLFPEGTCAGPVEPSCEPRLCPRPATVHVRAVSRCPRRLSSLEWGTRNLNDTTETARQGQLRAKGKTSHFLAMR